MLTVKHRHTVDGALEDFTVEALRSLRCIEDDTRHVKRQLAAINFTIAAVGLAFLVHIYTRTK